MPRITELPETTPMVAASPYVHLNQKGGNAALYDGVIYDPLGYDAHIWKLQRPVLERLIQRMAIVVPVRALDFACGTGRILQVVEAHAAYACGVDTSRDMLELAAQKCTRSEFFIGDVLVNIDLFDEPFDLITAFRFFTNTERELRLPVMKALAGLLRGPESLLVFNVHGHRPSVLSLTAAYRKLRGWPPVTTMSTWEIRNLVELSGLEIVDWSGYGLLPQRLYGSRFGVAAKRLDTMLSPSSTTRWISSDVVVICRRRGS